MSLEGSGNDHYTTGASLQGQRAGCRVFGGAAGGLPGHRHHNPHASVALKHDVLYGRAVGLELGQRGVRRDAEMDGDVVPVTMCLAHPLPVVGKVAEPERDRSGVELSIAGGEWLARHHGAIDPLRWHVWPRGLQWRARVECPHGVGGSDGECPGRQRWPNHAAEMGACEAAACHMRIGPAGGVAGQRWRRVPPMAKRGELFSLRSQSARRTYFFNVKENRTGTLFLNVVESKKRSTSASSKASFEEFERRSVMVFEDDLPAFMEALQEAVSFVQRRGRPSRARPSRARAQRETQSPSGPKKVRVRAKPKPKE